MRTECLNSRYAYDQPLPISRLVNMIGSSILTHSTHLSIALHTSLVKSIDLSIAISCHVFSSEVCLPQCILLGFNRRLYSVNQFYKTPSYSYNLKEKVKPLCVLNNFNFVCDSLTWWTESQIPTQRYGRRPFGVGLLLAGYDVSVLCHRQRQPLYCD